MLLSLCLLLGCAGNTGRGTGPALVNAERVQVLAEALAYRLRLTSERPYVVACKPEVVQLLTGEVRVALQSKGRLVDSIVVLSACGGSPEGAREPLRHTDRAVLWIDAVGVEKAAARVDINARMPTGHVQHEATSFARSSGSGRLYLVGFSTSGFTAEER